MAFSNYKVGKEENVDVKGERQAVIVEIQKLEKAKEEMEGNLLGVSNAEEEYKLASEKLSDLKSKIDKASLDLSSLEKQVKGITQEYSEWETKIEKIEQKENNLLAVLDKSNAELEESKIQKLVVNAECDKLAVSLEDLKNKHKELIDVQTAELSALDRLRAEKNNLLLEVERHIIELQKEEIRLSLENSKNENLLKDTIDLVQTNKQILDGLWNEKQRLLEEKQNLGVTIDKFKQTNEQPIKDKIARLDEREGLCSDKERFLVKKEEQLKQMKNDLEEFYNKKFDHIKI